MHAAHVSPFNDTFPPAIVSRIATACGAASVEHAPPRFSLCPVGITFKTYDPSISGHDGAALDFDLHPRETVPWYAVTTWTQQPDSDFYCVEPWLGLPDAIHHGQGLRWVAPGATERAVCALHFRQL